VAGTTEEERNSKEHEGFLATQADTEAEQVEEAEDGIIEVQHEADSREEDGRKEQSRGVTEGEI
jgi:hypothetical protein